ncbi:probable LRR receptor-like serine/threonine-protein kinase At4g37250 [Magnolia sinica]|uniref:probable LRR receptor-like serine/threonine-protein kinase At4g37250 n=1 Tax=Magnolia sinica TaxID=86752 RepID=UPI0026592C20|nr:probable LRR receptor-like serine/threonine-protein kinase At4g37250 [Magnolia sinica]
MNSTTTPIPIPTRRLSLFLLTLLSILPVSLSSLNSDGILLLSFKYSILSDPLSILDNWNYNDETPCSWTGVTCTAIPLPFYPTAASRVVGLALPNSKLLGSISPDLGYVEHLRNLDLSHNFFNGTLPASLFSSSELQVLDISDNEVSGELPELVGNLKSLEFLNLSDNALVGRIPDNLTSLPNLTVVSLRNNYLSGGLPIRFQSVEVLDLASNLVNGSLPPDFGGGNLRSLNLSYNRLSGEISPEFASQIPANATLDLSFNNLTGEIPEISTFLYQKPASFAGNPDLCGKPLQKSCMIPSTLPKPPPDTSTTSPPAIAAIPKTIGNSPGEDAAGNGTDQPNDGGLRPGTIAGIIVGDLAGIGLLSMLFIYIYQSMKKKRIEEKTRTIKAGAADEWSSSDAVAGGRLGWSCLTKKGGSDDDEENSDTTGSETEGEEKYRAEEQQRQQNKGGTLVTVDGESELEMETLLKASAYILGATGSSIVYKAVLEDGTAFAVRRIGDAGLERFRDFENQVRLIAKLRHPNLVRIRGFYWGEDEKLVIYDFVPNGSLANASYKRTGSSSPCHLPWEVRLRVARGVARGLTYLHEKKHVHGNLKPSNILLGPDMEPRIGDFGLERLVTGDNSSKTASGSARHFGSKRSTVSRDSLQDLQTGASPSLSIGCASPYHAPESLKNLKPQPKWDVFSFGMVLLELISGKLFSDAELSQWNSGFVFEDKYRVLRMADVAIRADVDGREDALLSCFKLGFSCTSVVPQKRPTMKEALQILEKIPSPSY